MYRIIRYNQPLIPGLSPALANRGAWTGWPSEADRLFEAALSDLAAPATSPRFPVDLFEDKDNTYVRAELPGVARDAIQVEMVDGFLNLSATRKDPAAVEPEKAPGFSLTRSVSIPTEVQADKVSATYENGVLTVTLPKQEQTKPRKINITVN